MKLVDVFTVIQRNLQENNFIITKHFIKRCQKRKFDIKQIQEIIKDNEILGIIQQRLNLYKLWFEFTESKDLNIVLTITADNQIKLITVYCCSVKRRKR